MSLIAYAMRMTKEYYDEKTYAHATRVAQYVAENNLIPESKMDNCIALAWMHDLQEDTNWSGSFSSEYEQVEKCLDCITKPKDMDYIEYIKRIRKWADTRQEAYWVKLADMKDHLAQTETLTDKLKEKYLTALPYFL